MEKKSIIRQVFSMSDRRHDINQVIRRVSAYLSFDLLLAAIAAAVYLGEGPQQVLHEWWVILTSPCPLVTDYFRLGSLPAALLNAGVCGTACALMTLWPKALYRPSVWAGYFLVIAHCFYGLNFINMWPPMLGFFIYCRIHNLRFRDNLDWAMFMTSFAPFMSELLFRYPMAVDIHFTVGGVSINPIAVVMCLGLSIFIGFALPAMIPGTAKLHRGYNLYNGGLATGLLGLFVYSFLFNTMGIHLREPLNLVNDVYDAHGQSYQLFITVFFALLAGASILYGWFLNGRTFKGYGKLLSDSGYRSNFLHDYGPGPTWMNLGFYLLMMLGYFNAVVLLTDGAGFTGATCGIILAAMTFAASGQHPKNVWPILLGYALLSLVVHGECFISQREIPWTLSTQGYMNGAAFATGLCPFTGKYGWKVGMLAGFISAVMCTTTSAMHAGFVLYNGGLTAGIAALILLPLLDTYMTHTEKWGQGEGRPVNPQQREHHHWLNWH